MATYIYETTDTKKPVRRFEIQQSMKDDALSKHPETGDPIRRVITGGFGYIGAGKTEQAVKPSGGGSCGSGCGCH